MSKELIAMFIVVALVFLVLAIFRRQRKTTKRSLVPDQPPIANKDLR